MTEAKALVQLAVDPKGTSKRLDQLGAKANEVKQLYKDLGIGKDAVKAREQAQDLRDTAERELEVAKVTAVEIVAAATAEAGNVKKAAEQIHRETMELAKTTQASSDAVSQALDVLDERTVTVEDREDAVTRAEIALEEAVRRQEERLVALTTAIAEYQKGGV
jgi:hypothetical protein